MSDLEPVPDRQPTVRGRLRVGTAGRERAIGVLKRAVGKGQLSLDEFEARVAIVYSATARDDIRPALEDLEEYQAVRADPRLSAFWLD